MKSFHFCNKRFIRYLIGEPSGFFMFMHLIKVDIMFLLFAKIVIKPRRLYSFEIVMVVCWKKFHCYIKYIYIFNI